MVAAQRCPQCVPPQLTPHDIGLQSIRATLHRDFALEALCGAVHLSRIIMHILRMPVLHAQQSVLNPCLSYRPGHKAIGIVPE
jgi:hypothetical protein